jgi:hypothetical protein
MAMLGVSSISRQLYFSALTRPIPVLRYRLDHAKPCSFSLRDRVVDLEGTLSSSWLSSPITSKPPIFSFMVSCPPRNNITTLGLKSPDTGLCTQTLRGSSVLSGSRVFLLCFVQEMTACSYDAHPMAILTSAFAYLGSYYSEANPSLQGITILFSISS